MFAPNAEQKSMAASLHQYLRQELGERRRCDKHLAKAMGVTLPTIGNWAKSKSISSSKTLDEIAAYLINKTGISDIGQSYQPSMNATGHSDGSSMNATSCPPSLPSPITRNSLGSHVGTLSPRFPADDGRRDDVGRCTGISQISLLPKVQPPQHSSSIVFSVMYNNIIDDARSRLCQSFGSQTRQSPRVIDNRSLRLPKWLLGDGPAKGGEIDLDGAVVVQQKLGSGAYGTVYLCSRKGNHQQSQQERLLAVKVQSPTRCLAHEHNMLCLIQDRVRVNQNASDGTDMTASSHPGNAYQAYPFPVALSYVQMRDGALLGMSAAESSTGHNLLDLVNAYKSNGEPISELLAIYYACRMLHHLEILHNIGKILHNDVKVSISCLVVFDVVISNRYFHI